MKRMVLLLAVIAITLSGHVTAQAGADFSGTWKSSSSLLTIKQDARTLIVTEGSGTRTYKLDGSESRFESSGAGGVNQYTARARWVQSALVIETKTVSKIGEWTDMEVYSLDFGPQLSVVRIYTQKHSPFMGTTLTTYTKG